MMYSENDIKAQLNNQSASVDTDQLWNDIKHHAPIKKRRNWLPLLFMFGLGGLVSAAIFSFFFQSPCLPNENKWQDVVDSLTTDNKQLKEIIHANVIEMEILKEEIRQANERLQNTKAQNNFNIYNHDLYSNAQPKLEYKVASNHSSITNTSHPENNITQSQVIAQSPLHQEKVELISTITSAQIVTETDRKEIDQPMLSPKIIPNQSKNNWQYLVGITSGAASVTDRQLNKEGNQRNTDFTPILSFTAELGLLKKVKGRLSLGILGNYSNTIYRLNYHSILTENISFIDTTEISISSAGSENVVIGNVGGKKITEQKGKVHGYQHRFSIIPMLQYNSLSRRKFQINHHLGLGIDILNISRNIIPTHDERSFMAQQVTGMTLKPYLRVGTNLEYFITKDLQATFIMQCTYRNESYNFSSYSGKRSAIFPSIGLGLHFY